MGYAISALVVVIFLYLVFKRPSKDDLLEERNKLMWEMADIQSDFNHRRNIPVDEAVELKRREEEILNRSEQIRKQLARYK